MFKVIIEQDGKVIDVENELSFIMMIADKQDRAVQVILGEENALTAEDMLEQLRKTIEKGEGLI